MAAPAATARQDPAGLKLRDGYQSLITLGLDPDIEFWEKVPQPPGVDGGDPIEQTTMHNDVWRTQSPRALKTLTPITVRVAYDPAVYPQIIAAINRPDTITNKWADGSTLAWFGYARSFIPDPLTEGQQPEAVLTLVPTNEDHANDYVESGPTLVSVAGT